jgi:hypothetical protein
MEKGTFLYDLEYRVRSLCQMLEGDGDENNIFERLEEIELQQRDIINSLQRLENQINLIMKAL